MEEYPESGRSDIAFSGMRINVNPQPDRTLLCVMTHHNRGDTGKRNVVMTCPLSAILLRVGLSWQTSLWSPSFYFFCQDRFLYAWESPLQPSSNEYPYLQQAVMTSKVLDEKLLVLLSWHITWSRLLAISWRHDTFTHRYCSAFIYVM